MKTAGIIVIILFFTSSCMMMMPGMHNNNNNNNNMHSMHGNQNLSVLIDPVCHESVNTDSVKYYEYNGELYPFESEECMAVFKKNPQQFIAYKPIIKNRQMQTFVSFVGGSVFMLVMMALMVF